jgi:hypothetical protein
MKEFQYGMKEEIVSLTRRVAQLELANTLSDRLLATLWQQANSARSMRDVAGADRIDRRAGVVRRRRVRADAEINTLHDLIAARCRRYSLDPPRRVGPESTPS